MIWETSGMTNFRQLIVQVRFPGGISDMILKILETLYLHCTIIYLTSYAAGVCKVV